VKVHYFNTKVEQRLRDLHSCEVKSREGLSAGTTSIDKIKKYKHAQIKLIKPLYNSRNKIIRQGALYGRVTPLN